jgi:hypothetical protein
VTSLSMRRRGAERGRRLGLVAGGEQAEDAVVDLGVEDGEPQTVGSEGTQIAVRDAGDEPNAGQARQVVVGLVRAVAGAEQPGHQGAQALEAPQNRQNRPGAPDLSGPARASRSASGWPGANSVTVSSRVTISSSCCPSTSGNGSDNSRILAIRTSQSGRLDDGVPARDGRGFHQPQHHRGAASITGAATLSRWLYSLWPGSCGNRCPTEPGRRAASAALRRSAAALARPPKFSSTGRQGKIVARDLATSGSAEKTLLKLLHAGG